MQYIVISKSGKYFQAHGIPWTDAEDTAKDFGCQEHAESFAKYAQTNGRMNGFAGCFTVLTRKRIDGKWGYQLVSEWEV